jgi:hypothetical protein
VDLLLHICICKQVSRIYSSIETKKTNSQEDGGTSVCFNPPICEGGAT